MVDGRFGAKFASVWVAAFFGGVGYSFLLFAGGVVVHTAAKPKRVHSWDCYLFL